MTNLPAGTVTFLYTDIEGSSRLWQLDAAAMRAAVEWHETIVRGAIERYSGLVFRTGGDAFSAAFDNASGALAAATEIQQSLHGQVRPAGSALTVRVVLHTTEAEVSRGDYVGSGLNRLGRMLGVCHGGQTLVSQATERLVRNHLPEGVALWSLGRHRLRDLGAPEEIFQVVAPGLPREFPPLSSLDATPNNLPQQVTSFVGRERERAELAALLEPPGLEDQQHTSAARLITLIGPGGTGKTRLALRVADEALDRFPDGVWLVELAPLVDERLVTHEVAAPLGLREQPGRPLEAMLIDYLRPRRLLLLLDNCEHLIDACARLADALLRACPNLRIVASSREALGIAGEQIFRVRSLQLPRESEMLAADDLASFEAIRLFVERAGAVQPGFALDSDNASAVLQICRRLDGIPLAIELAAARVRVLAPQQIAERLDDRFRLLTGGNRTALPRQRTLHALIDWSYDLLSPAERSLLRRLSVFSGGWTLDAAEAVCSGDDIEAYEVLDLLDQLVNKSLVLAEESAPGMRYRMLETIRQYAQEKLAESDEPDKVRRRHLAFRVGQMEEAWDALARLRGVELQMGLRDEVDNILAVHTWALDHDLAAALRLALPWSNSYSERLRLIQESLRLAEQDPAFGSDGPIENQSLLGIALVGAASESFYRGYNRIALDYARRAVEIGPRIHTTEWFTGALVMGATIAATMGDLPTASQWLREGLRRAETTDNQFTKALALVGLFAMPDVQQSASPELQWSNWQQGMAMYRAGGILTGQSIGHMVAARRFVMQNRVDDARFHAQQALDLFRELGDRVRMNAALSILADLDRQQGNYEAAVGGYQQNVGAWRDIGNRGAVARCLECLAFISHAWTRELDPEQRRATLAWAAALLGAAHAVRQSNQAAMTAYEQTEYEAELAAIHAAVGEEEFAAAWQRGERMSLDEAVAFAAGDYLALPKTNALVGV